MKIIIKDGLPYVSVILMYRGESLKLDKVILDTGSTGTLFSLDKLSEIGVIPEAEDIICRINGVGGSEFVFTKQIDKLTVGELEVNDLFIEIGGMDYGFELDGIVGMNFLLQTNAVIDLSQLEIYQINPHSM